ncbi:MAG TPA: PfkB family carbohydrate kinase [Dehalococcoidia bacterium]|nr:PfkB family carbohydrate kinase [Dehalococcoidia bacterium]
MSAPDFVVAGHAVRDVIPGGWRMGGTVTFAAVQAHRLGLSVGVVTRAADDLDVAAELPFAEVVRVPSETTTTFENVYVAGQRKQRVLSRAGDIRAEDVPDAWRAAPIVLLGPVLGELAPEFGGRFAGEGLLGVSAQGWLRALDGAGHVRHTPWTGAPFWTGADVLFVSDEDLAEGDAMLERWTREVPAVAMTESWRGARVHSGGAWRRMDAFPETEVDPTGAGDTFATALLVRLRETGDVLEAARFGAAAASISVGGVAAEAIADRAAIEARLRAYPQVALR